MNQSKREIWRGPLGWALVVLLGGSVIAGCFLDSEQKQVMGPGGGENALKAVLSSLSGTGQPRGDYEVANTAPLADDVFARATGEFPFFSGTRYRIDDAARNVSNDPRSPALGGSGTEAVGSGQCRFGHSGFWFSATNPGFGWDFFCFLEGLKPSTDYTVMLARYSLTVNGQLDTRQMLLSGAISQPDALSLLGGTPGGYPEEDCDFSTARPTYTVGVTGDQNPLVLGFVTTDANGSLTFDCLVGSGGFWQAGPQDLTVPDSAPFAPNALATSGLPRYNYVLVVEGKGTVANPVPTGPVVMRFQVGVDTDASGNPIPNGYAPLPAAAAPPLVQVDLELRGLAEISSGGGYGFWVYNSETQEFIRQLTGNLTVLDPDEGIIFVEEDSVDLVTGFNNARALTQFEVTNVSEPDGWVTEGDLVVVTLEGLPGQGSPGQVVMWARIQDSPGDESTLVPAAGLHFGTFASEYEYAYSGSGTAYFFGDELRLELKNLSRPPVGYFYEVWLSGATDLSLGPLTTPFPDYESLLNADVQEGGVVVGTFIRDAALLKTGTDLGVNWGDYTSISVTLSPKNRAGLPVSTAMQAAVPEGAGG